MSKKRFKIGARVNGISFSGKSILGEYRGVRASYGVWIYGIETGSFDPAKLHICQALTLELAPLPLEKRKQGRPKTYKHTLKAGDPCKSITKSGLVITGFYMDSSGKDAWIKGWPLGTSKFEPKQAYKVLTQHLESTDA